MIIQPTETLWAYYRDTDGQPDYSRLIAWEWDDDHILWAITEEGGRTRHDASYLAVTRDELDAIYEMQSAREKAREK